MCGRVIFVSLVVVSFLGISGTIPSRADFDREACERACRSRYMGPGVFKDRESGHQLMSLDTCIQDCEKRFWEDFGRKTDETEKSDKDRWTR